MKYVNRWLLLTESYVRTFKISLPRWGKVDREARRMRRLIRCWFLPWQKSSKKVQIKYFVLNFDCKIIQCGRYLQVSLRYYLTIDQSGRFSRFARKTISYRNASFVSLRLPPSPTGEGVVRYANSRLWRAACWCKHSSIIVCMQNCYKAFISKYFRFPSGISGRMPMTVYPCFS